MENITIQKLFVNFDINMIKSFLDSNYLTLESNGTNTVYSKELLQYCLKDSTIIGIFTKDKDKCKNILIGIISGKQLDIIEDNNEKRVVEVNFLSVSKEYRNLGLVKILRENFTN